MSSAMDPSTTMKFLLPLVFTPVALQLDGRERGAAARVDCRHEQR